MINKPYAESCDQNRDVILEVIQPLLLQSRSVLEMASQLGLTLSGDYEMPANNRILQSRKNN